MTDDLAERGREGLKRILAEQPFLAGLDAPHLELLHGCASNVRFETGAFLLREGEPANAFYLLREGRVALEIHAPGGPPVVFQTLGPGEVVGVSWLVPPYRWSYDARALEPVRAVGLDAACLRRKCDADHHLGYAMMTRFVPLLVGRLQATRMQILDVYGHHG
ncbi:MAG: cyclic nucleotide-binding domain-containing protein [Alphaproteobacteria bacterium]|nr:cyclic nucleotide-binding domain-containing protein [Alphaproteobacteria bacterium]